MNDLPYVHDPQVEETMLASMPWWLRNKPVLRALVQAMAVPAQEVEDSVWNIITGLDPQTAVGVILDRWGKIVGQPRDGMTDTEYRRFILIRVRANRHDGRADDLIGIWRDATGALSVRYDQLAGPYFQLQAVTPLPLDAAMRARLRQLIEDVRPGGVGADLVSSEEGAFGFEDDPDALGFDDGTLAESF